MPVIVGIGMMFMQICTGINTIIYYTATIFQAAGFTDTLGALYATIGVGVVNFLMTFVAIFLTVWDASRCSMPDWPASPQACLFSADHSGSPIISATASNGLPSAALSSTLPALPFPSARLAGLSSLKLCR